MPTINFSLKDLNSLLHKKITLKELEELIEFAKGEIENYDEQTDEVTASLDDTNQPYLWSAEGLARFFKGVQGTDTGIPRIKLEQQREEIIADKSIHTIRPFITGFIARGPEITDYMLKQMVQLQEKFCDNYGRKRRNASIGLYSFKRIKFPVHYKAVIPESIRFVPLEFDRPLNLKEILTEHPKGKEYGHIISQHDKFPILIDDAGKVLSLPPIINSNDLGKLEIGDTEFLFECTGMDEETVNLGTAIVAYALADRGFKIEPMKMKYPKTTPITPILKEETTKITRDQIRDLIGLEPGESEIKKLLGKARYDYNSGTVTIPPYRGDILHPFDVIEDIAIMHGYDKIESQPMQTYTIGGTFEIQKFVDKIRDLAAGLQYQEVISPVLSNKKLLCEQARFPDNGIVEIENYMSETYSVVRSTLIPILLDVLSKNKHIDYPQKVFEEGLVTRKHGDAVIDYEMLSLASTHSLATFTEAKQATNAILSSLGIKGTYGELEHPTFIPGRAARVTKDGTEIAILGEVHPQVLENFGLELPVVAVEINLSALFGLKR
ncbi:MAG: phenylalanine--tRNA ligase subunit beta [Nanoarchaeota archaeon]